MHHHKQSRSDDSIEVSVRLGKGAGVIADETRVRQAHLGNLPPGQRDLCGGVIDARDVYRRIVGGDHRRIESGAAADFRDVPRVREI